MLASSPPSFGEGEHAWRVDKDLCKGWGKWRAMMEREAEGAWVWREAGGGAGAESVRMWQEAIQAMRVESVWMGRCVREELCF